MTAAADDRLRDESALRHLVLLYARAVDRNEPELFASLFLDDALIEGPGFRAAGREELRQVPGQLVRKYLATMHCVFNQTVDIAGDSATGETYCSAFHRMEGEDGRPMTLEWAIRYQDRFARRGGQWYIGYRRLVVEWTRTTAVELLPNLPA
jgi:uncharacterized protein (TIGR02246 family)